MDYAAPPFFLVISNAHASAVGGIRLWRGRSARERRLDGGTGFDGERDRGRVQLLHPGARAARTGAGDRRIAALRARGGAVGHPARLDRAHLVDHRRGNLEGAGAVSPRRRGSPRRGALVTARPVLSYNRPAYG